MDSLCSTICIYIFLDLLTFRHPETKVKSIIDNISWNGQNSSSQIGFVLSPMEKKSPDRNSKCCCSVALILISNLVGLTGRLGWTCSSPKVRSRCSPGSLQPPVDTSSLQSRSGANAPQNICSPTALTESHWHTIPRPGPDGGPRSAAPSSPCPGQIGRRTGPQVPPQAGLCHSPMTTLWWLPMFLPVKRQIVQQTALLWIHPAVSVSKEVKENPWPDPLNFQTEARSEKVALWTGSKEKPALRLTATPQCEAVNPAGRAGSPRAAPSHLGIIRSNAIPNRNPNEDEGRTFENLFCGNSRAI